MECRETQRCIQAFLKDELDRRTAEKVVEHIQSCDECMEELTIEYLLLEGISRLENADDIDLNSELEERLDRVRRRKKRYSQLKAGLFLLVCVILCIYLL